MLTHLNFQCSMFNVQWKIRTFAPAFETTTGEMVEWSITVVLKTTVPRGTGGSNPSLSAKSSMSNIVGLFFCDNAYS